VTFIGGDLWITRNDTLSSLMGLDNLVPGSIVNLGIINNSSLVTCEVQCICEYLASPNGTINIYNNANGCNNPPEIANSCGITLPCLPYGNYYFYTQSEIDDFQVNYPGCTELEGNVVIYGDDITNLNGLYVLTSIGGNLRIINNDALTSLTGLDNLTSIGGDLVIGDYNGGNPALTSLSGLDNLTSIGGDLDIYNNSALTSLTGLDNLTSIGGGLQIRNNDALTSLTGLDNMTSIWEDIEIDSNPALINLTGLDNLTSIGGNLWIDDNDALTSLTGLDNLTSIGGALLINYNDSLTSLTGLSNLVSIGGDLGIYRNDALTSLTGLEGLTTISGSLSIGTNFYGYILGNTSLTSLTGLDHVISIGGDLEIIGNYSLSTCEVESICNYLASPNGAISIYDNAPGCNSQEEVQQACPTISVEELEPTGQLCLFPNPFSNSVTIEYKLAYPGITEINIYNQIGQVIKEFVHQESRVGINKLIWQTEDILSGIYFIRLQAGKEIITKKIIKL